MSPQYRGPLRAVRGRILLLALLLTLLPPLAAASSPSYEPSVGPFFWLRLRWTPQRYGPPDLSSVVFDPAVPGLALATEGAPKGAVYRSTDGGLTWSELPKLETPYPHYLMRLTYGNRPNTFYAYGGVALFKTEDAGNSWTALPYDYNCDQITGLVSHPITPTLLFATTGRGFTRSLDGGQTWGWTAGDPFDCARSPMALSLTISADQPTAIYVSVSGDGYGVRKSTDLGETWEAVSTGLPDNTGGVGARVWRVAADPRDGDTVYAVLQGTGEVYRTTNGGGLWEPYDQGIKDVKMLTLRVEPSDGYMLYAASGNRVYYRADGAAAWRQAGGAPVPPWYSGPPDNVQIAPDPHSPNIMFVQNSHVSFGAVEHTRVHLPVVRQKGWS